MYNEQTGMYEGYIYCITNLENNKKYIGQTRNSIEHRWHDHYYGKNYDKTKNYLLYRAMEKYGNDKFAISEIAHVQYNTKEELIDNLNKLEIKFVKEYNTYANDGYGYNMTRGGTQIPEYKKIKVDMYDLNGIFIKSFNSMLEAAIELNVEPTVISQCCYGKIRTVLKKYTFRFNGDSFDKYSVYRKTSKTYYKFDLNGNLVQEYPSRKVLLEKDKIPDTSLSRIMKEKRDWNGYYYSLEPVIDISEYHISKHPTKTK